MVVIIVIMAIIVIVLVIVKNPHQSFLSKILRRHPQHSQTAVILITRNIININIVVIVVIIIIIVIVLVIIKTPHQSFLSKILRRHSEHPQTAVILITSNIININIVVVVVIIVIVLVIVKILIKAFAAKS